MNRAEQILLEAAKCSLKLKSTKSKTKIRRITPKKWFDKDCNVKRIALRRLSNQKHRDPLNVSIRESYHKALKEYKQLLASKQKAFHDNKIQKLQEIPGSSNSEHFWYTLKSMNDDITEKKIPPISEDQWLHHLESLHSATMNNSKQEKIVSDLKAMEQSENDLTALNGPITEREIQDTITKLKNNKAEFSDKIKNEMIKAGLSSLMPMYKKLFNLVLNSGSFPDSWCQGLITPIFKSGKKEDPSNYRGICVASCLGKLFCSVLNHRLLSFVSEKKLLHPSQIGFLPGHRTADHVFTLRTLIDKHVSHRKEPIYACFVDFKKAFDSIWHKGLLYKLLSSNINGNFYNLIKDLYSKSNCSIKLDQHKTKSFKYLRGVRQGCILSPLLFNLYLNDLPFLLDNTSHSDPLVLPNGVKLNSLLYADDLILLSRSQQGLQNCLNKLQSFCDDWKMTVNLKKTKTMIFQKKVRKPRNAMFFLNGHPIESTQEYTYLGVKLSPTGNFTITHEQLRDKAMHSFFGISKYTDISTLPPQLASKIFDSMIVPILTYHSEVWGAYTKTDFNRWDTCPIEKVHLRFCKTFLRTNRRASNLACRAELGRYPLKIAIDQRILNYILHLKAQPESTLARQAFKISKQLHSIGKDGFYASRTYSENTTWLLTTYQLRPTSPTWLQVLDQLTLPILGIS